ncbi:MAG: hypothetical protein IPM16_17030 [Chloroflexi bacterium]|nr:hypothetical protein [Chloroflexota bacterium]
MPAVRFPIRPWLYLAAAAVLLAVPLARYTDDGNVLALLWSGMLTLTLITYTEITTSVRHATRILSAVYGQRDLLVLAGFSIAGVRGAIWCDLWHRGGWASLCALWVSRLALGLALAQYLHLYLAYVPDIPLAQPVNQALTHLNFISHNGPYETPVLRNPLWWQGVVAGLGLALVILAETHLMMVLGMTVYIRNRRTWRWVGVLVSATRVGIAGFALIGLIAFAWLEDQLVLPRPVRCTTIDGGSNIELAWHLSDEDRALCRWKLPIYVAAQASTAAQLGMLTLLDGGSLAAADIMRVTRARPLTDTWFAFGSQYASTSSYFPQWHRPFSGVMVPILRPFAGVLFASMLTLAASEALLEWLRRRYRLPSSR